MTGEGSRAESGRTGEAHSRRVWALAAALLFAVALVTPFQQVWRAGIGEFVPFFWAGKPAPAGWQWVSELDLHFVSWLVPRNSRTLISEPWSLYDTEICHPETKMLARGEPMLTLGLIGVPFYATTRDPIATYNLVLVTVTFLSGMAMYWLIAEWSGVPAAGIAAGLLYAFHASKISNVVHPYIDDTVYTLLALFFVRHYFETGRWRNAIPTGVFCALQIGGSFYAFFAATLIALPVLAWLVHQYGVSKLGKTQVAAIAVLIAGAVAVVFVPALAEIASVTVSTRWGGRVFALFSDFAPGGRFGHGWFFYGLAFLGLVLARRHTLAGIGADPRWALALGAALIAITVVQRETAAHPPLVYSWLAGFVPGLAQVRAPGTSVSGIHLVLAIFGGLGCAGLIRLAPASWRQLLGVALVAAVYLAVLRPGLLGLQPLVVYEPVRMRPSESSIAFFEALEELGNRGALAEIPSLARDQGERISLVGYHHRRVSACSTSVAPSELGRVTELLNEIPTEDSIRELYQMGFTTIIVHDGGGGKPKRRWVHLLAQKLVPVVNQPNPILRKIHGDDSMKAFEIRPRPDW